MHTVCQEHGVADLACAGCLDAATRKLETMKADYDARGSEIARLEDEADGLDTEVEALKAEIARQKAYIEDRYAEAVGLRKSHADMVLQLSVAQSNYANAQATCDGLSEAKREMKRQLDLLTLEVLRLNSCLREVDGRNAEMAEARAKLMNQYQQEAADAKLSLVEARNALEVIKETSEGNDPQLISIHSIARRGLKQSGDIEKPLKCVRCGVVEAEFAQRCRPCYKIDFHGAALPDEATQCTAGPRKESIEKRHDAFDHTAKPIHEELAELSATVPPEEWLKLKTHPLTCGECRAEIRTDICPACAGKQQKG